MKETFGFVMQGSVIPSTSWSFSCGLGIYLVSLLHRFSSV